MTRRCFTLVEMVVAMVIMMVVAMIIGTAGMTFYNGYTRSVRGVARLDTCLAVDRIFDTLIRNMIPFKWNDAENTSRLVFDGKTDEILFTALRRSYGNDIGGLLFVRLFVEDEQLIAEYAQYPLLPWSEDEEKEGVEREVIAKNVASISFEYAEFDGEEGIEWNESWEEDEHDTLPLAVRMTLEWTDGTKEYWLRRTAGNSRETTFGYRAVPSTVTGNTGN